jgi:hypothetical protein
LIALQHESPESLPLIRSFLIDSWLCTALRAVGCAKLFGCTYMHVANSVNAKCNPFRAKIFTLKRPLDRYRNPYFIALFVILSRCARISAARCTLALSSRLFVEKLRWSASETAPVHV